MSASEIVHYLLNTNRNVILTGGAGVGKTYTTKSVIRELNRLNIDYRLCSTTGTAARQLADTAVTWHSLFGVKPKDHDLASLMDRGYTFGHSPQVIILDEMSMFTELNMDLMVEILHNPQLSDAGKTANGVQHKQIQEDILQNGWSSRTKIMLVGDLLQLAPVSFTESAKTFISSKYYEICNFHTIELSKVFRQKDERFIDILNKVRKHVIDADVGKFIEDSQRNCQDLNAVHLFSRNAPKNRHNDSCLQQLAGPKFVFKAFYVYGENATVQQRNMHECKKCFVLPDLITLAKGATVMLMENTRREDIFKSNGDIGVVEELTPKRVTVRFNDDSVLDFWSTKTQYYELRYNVGIGRMEKVEVYSQSQIPLLLAYAITIDKAQGQTLQSGTLHIDDMDRPGQFYSGLSRFAVPEKVRVVAKNIRSALSVAKKRKHDEEIHEFYRPIKRRAFDINTLLTLLEDIQIQSLRTVYESMSEWTPSQIWRQLSDLRKLYLQQNRSTSRLDVLFGLGFGKSDTIALQCSGCGRDISERELFMIGAACCCIPARSLFALILQKYGYYSYLIQRPGLSLTETVLYIGITTTDQRLRQHEAGWLDGSYVVRISLRIHESDLIRMLRPIENKHLNGNHYFSHGHRLSNGTLAREAVFPKTSDIVHLGIKRYITGAYSALWLSGVGDLIVGDHVWVRDPTLCYISDQPCTCEKKCSILRLQNISYGLAPYDGLHDSQVLPRYKKGKALEYTKIIRLPYSQEQCMSHLKATLRDKKSFYVDFIQPFLTGPDDMKLHTVLRSYFLYNITNTTTWNKLINSIYWFFRCFYSVQTQVRAFPWRRMVDHLGDQSKSILI